MTLEEAGISPQSVPVDISGIAQVEECSFSGGRCAVSGKVRFSMLFDREDEYSSSDVEIPFRYDTGAYTSSDGKNGACFACEVISARARVDGERLGIDAEIGVCGNTWENKTIKILDKVSFDEEVQRSGGQYTVCYPSAADSLWSVAKRYNMPISDITVGNSLSEGDSPDSESSLEGINYLII